MGGVNWPELVRQAREEIAACNTLAELGIVRSRYRAFFRILHKALWG